MTWHVAGPSEFLVITGFFVKDVKIAKKAWILVGQKCGKIDITPVNYSFDVRAMSSEKLPFKLPATYTIGPDAVDTEALCKYAKLVAAHEFHSPHVNKIVAGIIEGETRVLAAGMEMEQIFKGSDDFKRRVKEGVQLELQKLGLHVYNANVMELKDVEGQQYFSYLGVKAQKDAENLAKVAVADALLLGDTGAKERDAQRVQKITEVEAKTRKYTAEQEGLVEQRKAEVEARTRVSVNEKKEEMGKADNELALKKAMWKKQAAIANVEAEKETELREMEIQAEVARKKAEVEMETGRADVVVKASIRKAASQEEARADLFRRERDAEASLYEQKQEAEARESLASADSFAGKRAAEARLYAKVKEAEALRAHAAAVAYYVRVMSWAVIRVLAVLLLLMHVSSWLIVSRVQVADSNSTGVGLPNFFINNAIVHYLLPPPLPLAPPAGLHEEMVPHDNLQNLDNNLHDDNSVDPSGNGNGNGNG